MFQLFIEDYKLLKVKKILIPILFVLLFQTISFAQTPQHSIHDLKTGKWKTDTTYVYQLPYTLGKRYLLIQGYNSSFSHKNEIALDFKMKKGTPICAARDGVVTALREDSDKGGFKPEFLSEGNFIVLLHNDSTEAHYWHLQKDGAIVKEGDTVKTGQTIGYSGNTGYSAFPHLHFEVVNKLGQQIPTRFSTKKGMLYLRPGRKYKRV